MGRISVMLSLLKTICDRVKTTVVTIKAILNTLLNIRTNVMQMNRRGHAVKLVSINHRDHHLKLENLYKLEK
jgi:hypothetical protein